MTLALALGVGTAGLALVAFALVRGTRELRALVHLSPAPLAPDEPLLVVVPARNEAHAIAACLERVLADPSPALRVLVVDDRSTDDTARIVGALAARDGRLALLALDDDPPPGAFGKPRALARAVDHARAALYAGALPGRLVFLDADVLLEPGALGGLARAHAARAAGGALSGLPRLDVRTPVEQLFVPTIVALVTSAFGPTRVHLARAGAPERAFLNGQLIVVDTRAYEAAGGFAAVSGTVLEDVALARLLAARGAPVRLADLRAFASTRMYASWRAIVEGFGKNATALLGPHAWRTGALAFVVSLLPWTAVALDVRAWPLLVVTLALQLFARTRLRAPLWPVVVLPLSYAGACFVLARASWRAWRKAPLTWKGRSY